MACETNVYPCIGMRFYQLVYVSPLGSEIVSLLPLQISLYFNVWYAPLWMISLVVALLNKVEAPMGMYGLKGCGSIISHE